MNLRIFAGQANDRDYAEVGELKNLYKSQNLVVQGSKDVVQIDLDGGRKAYLEGSLLGIRSTHGEIEPCSLCSISVKNRNRLA